MAKNQGQLTIGLFGRSGCGKTTLLSVFQGILGMDNSLERNGYQVVVNDDLAGALLKRNYSCIQYGAQYPEGTDKEAEYVFKLRIKGCRKFAPLEVVFYDYPGKWWDGVTKSADETQVRYEYFRKILECQVGILMFDSGKYLIEGHKYIKNTLDQFRATIANIKDDAEEDERPIIFSDESQTRQWIFVFTKSDVLEKNAKDIYDDIMSDSLIKEEIKSLAEELEIKSLGENILLISAAPKKAGTEKIDKEAFEKRIDSNGLDALAPICFDAVIKDLKRSLGEEKQKLSDGGNGIWNDFRKGFWNSLSFLSDTIYSLTPLIESLLVKNKRFKAAALLLPSIKILSEVSAKKIEEVMSKSQDELSSKEKDILTTYTLQQSWKTVLDRAIEEGRLFSINNEDNELIL